MAHHVHLRTDVGMGLTHRADSSRLHQQQGQAMTTATCAYIGSTDYSVLQPTCCTPTLKGRAYCEEHLWLVYKKGTAVHRKKDVRTADHVRMIEQLMTEAIEELIEDGEI